MAAKQETTHSILEGKVNLYKRGNSRHWQCSAYIGGKNRRISTKEESLSRAKDFAEDWYLTLRDMKRRGELIGEKTFADVAPIFLREFEVITEGQRNRRYVQGHHTRLNLHLIPFFGKMGLSQITAGKVQEYRMHRIEKAKARPLKDETAKPGVDGAVPTKPGKLPARNTIHQELVVLRQVLKTAIRHGWLAGLPDLTAPYKASTKISHRAWFSQAEYKQLYEATRRRVQNPPKPRWKWSYEQLHDYVLFMANTGLRPDEAARLQHRDVEITKDEATGEKVLMIAVRGKRGTGWCVSTPSAVRPYQRLKARPLPEETGRKARRLAGGEEAVSTRLPGPTDPVFPGNHRELFNAILEEEKLKVDREGNPRTAYSLRHTYICLRLMEGADIYQIAKNCRTSVEMIEKYYASHIKTTLDAAAINVRRPRPKKGRTKAGDGDE